MKDNKDELSLTNESDGESKRGENVTFSLFQSENACLLFKQIRNQMFAIQDVKAAEMN